MNDPQNANSDISEKLKKLKEKIQENFYPIIDENISKEEEGFKGGKLDKDAKESEFKRSQDLLNLGSKLSRILLIIAFFIITCGLCLWAYHIFMPDRWTWLTKDQLEKIEGLGKIAFGAILGYYLHYFKIPNKS